jgi:hypothetical protein
MASNLTPQGSLNRLRASVVVASYPQLNVIPPNLGKEGIGLAFEGGTTTYIDTLTGAVTSPEPYQRVTVTAALLRTQNLANLYKIQLELDARIGDLTVRADSSNMQPWYLTNCSIMSVAELKFDGTAPEFRVTLGGVYYINSALWGGA